MPESEPAKVIAAFKVECPGVYPETSKVSADAVVSVYSDGKREVTCPYLLASECKNVYGNVSREYMGRKFCIHLRPTGSVLKAL